MDYFFVLKEETSTHRSVSTSSISTSLVDDTSPDSVRGIKSMWTPYALIDQLLLLCIHPLTPPVSSQLLPGSSLYRPRLSPTATWLLSGDTPSRRKLRPAFVQSYLLLATAPDLWYVALHRVLVWYVEFLSNRGLEHK